MARLLVIDADTAGRGIIRSRMIDAGHEVQVAEGAEKGIEAALNEALDAVLIACQLDPGFDGVTVCQDLCRRDELLDTPVVLYALGEAPEDLLNRGIDTGAHTVVTPDLAPQLERMVEAALSTRKRMGALVERGELLRQEQRLLATELRRTVETEGEGATAPPEGAQSAGRPDALLLVDAGGVVRFSDRNAWALFGARSVGMPLRELALGTGLDTFVRDARNAAQEGYRFDLPGTGGRPSRPLEASAYPLSEHLRAVLVNDRGRRSVAAEAVRDHEPAIPLQHVKVLLEAAVRIHGLDRIHGAGPIAAAIRRAIGERAADKDPVLVIGEAGTGRAFVSRVLHYQTPDAGSLLELRCSAFSPKTLRAELFGCELDEAGGAPRPGVLRVAAGGTVLLEEVESLTRGLQETLLEVLTTGKLPRGDRFEGRLIATAQTDLGVLAAEGRFLGGLADHLLGGRIDIPPLRERGNELVGIVRAIVVGWGGAGIDEEALRVLRGYAWPRNMAELEEVLETALNTAAGEPIRVEHLPRSLTDPVEALRVDVMGDLEASDTEEPRQPWSIGPDSPISFDFYERQVILRALHKCKGDKIKTAEMLGVGKSTLYRKLRRLEL